MLGARCSVLGTGGWRLEGYTPTLQHSRLKQAGGHAFDSRV